MSDSEDSKSIEELEVGDKIHIDGFIDVPGLKDGHKYRVEGVEHISEEVTVYVLYNIDLDLQLKPRKDRVDRVLGRDHRVDVIGVEGWKEYVLHGYNRF